MLEAGDCTVILADSNAITGYLSSSLMIVSSLFMNTRLYFRFTEWGLHLIGLRNYCAEEC